MILKKSGGKSQFTNMYDKLKLVSKHFELIFPKNGQCFSFLISFFNSSDATDIADVSFDRKQSSFLY